MIEAPFQNRFEGINHKTAEMKKSIIVIISAVVVIGLTAFGLINLALELFSVFDGQEIDDFTTSMGGVSLTYLPERSRNPFFLKFWLLVFKVRKM